MQNDTDHTSALRKPGNYKAYNSKSVMSGVMAKTGQFQLRQTMVLSCLFVIFSLVGGNLVSLAVFKESGLQIHHASPLGVHKFRPDILDSEGQLLATDIEAPSLYADPSGLMEPAKVVKKLKTKLPELDEMDLLRQMTHEDRQFVFIKRGMHPKLAQEVFDLGLPGVDVTKEIRRVYPKGQLAGFVLGHVDIDNVGRSGIEKFIDKQREQASLALNLRANDPVTLSINVAASHILEQELARAMKDYKAKAAAGVVMNVNSGEVVALSSLPGVDPQNPSLLLNNKKRFDRVSGGVYELGSVFKTVTMAMVLEKKLASLKSQVDVTGPLKIGGHSINDYHGVKGKLTLEDIFVRSSNIGTAKLALKAGPKTHRSFLKKLHLLDPVETELGEMRKPETAERWGDVHSATASYGHGLALPPLQFAASIGALVNGGIYVPPTFIKRSEREGKALGERVISVETSDQVRKLLRLNVTSDHGTARAAEVAPYRVGGKTGTANKVVKGKYSKDKVRTSFVGIFPYDKPEYLVFVMLDEPQATAASRQLTVAGANAAPTTGRIISRLAPIFKVKPFYPVLNRLTALR